MKKIKILHLEDSNEDSELIHSIINSAEIELDYYITDNEKDYLNILEKEHINLILSDYNLPEYNGNEALKVAKEQYSHIPFIFVSGTMGEDTAINAMLNGATDYVLKNKLERLVPAIKRAIHESEIEINRKRAENLLKDSEEKFRSYIEYAPDGVFIIDETGRYIDVNRSACRITGYSKSEIEQMSIQDLLADESLEDGLNLFKKLLETGVLSSELFFKRKDNSTCCFSLDAVKLSDTRFLGFAKDISQRKRAEQELFGANRELIIQNKEKEKHSKELIKAKEKAEESDNLKSAFLHNLSHEIRTPMNQILGFASLLKDPDLTEILRDDYIRIINDQSHQLLHIISDIVEISEISTGQADVKLSTFNLGKMMDDLLAAFKPQTELRRLHFSLHKKIADEDAWIQGDQVKLKHVFSHLIENAIKYTDAGSIDVEYSRTGNNIIVTVKDTGIGISEQEQEVIFNQFRQIEITLSRKYGGLGLGLSISNAYIRMMSGIIRVESKPGQGSTFFVEIPYMPAIQIPYNTKKVFHTKVSSYADWHDKALLIVDDEDSNVQFLKAVLRSTGIKFLIATNGLEAVEQCKIHPEIDMIFMDIKMPRMDGLEATKIIKSFRSDLPVVALTAYAMTNDKEYILGAGCDDYVSKPFTQEELIAKVRKFIGSREAIIAGMCE